MKPLGWKKQIDSPHHAASRISGVLGQNKSFLHYVGWKSENIPPPERYFFLTSPFIELYRDLASITVNNDGNHQNQNYFFTYPPFPLAEVCVKGLLVR